MSADVGPAIEARCTAARSAPAVPAYKQSEVPQLQHPLLQVDKPKPHYTLELTRAQQQRALKRSADKPSRQNKWVLEIRLEQRTSREQLDGKQSQVSCKPVGDIRWSGTSMRNMWASRKLVARDDM